MGALWGAGQRAAGRWTEAYDQLWQSLQQRHGKQAGTRLMIEVLQLGRGSGYSRLTQAVEQALQLGTHDAAAVRYLLSQSQQLLSDPSGPLIEPLRVEVLPALSSTRSQVVEHFARPLPDLSDYDLLLGAYELGSVAQPREVSA